MLQTAGLFSYLRDSAYAYPVLLSLHIAALAMLAGMVLLTDLRLLDLGMRRYSVSDLVRGLRVPKRCCFLFAAVCGALLLGVQADQYHAWFRVKLSLLVLIGLNYLLFHRGADRVSGKTRLGAGLSLLLWAGVVFAARGPATIKDIMHAMVDPSGDYLFQSVRMVADEQGIREVAPQTDAQWERVRQRVVVLLDAPALLTREGRLAARPRDRSRNPQVENQPAEVQKLLDAERPDFIRRAQRLHDAAAVAMTAVEAKDKDALLRALDGVDKACESCHLHYWYPKDQRAREAAKEDGVLE